MVGRRRRRTGPALGRRGSRRRVWVGAAGFGALAVLLALVGLVGGDRSWLGTALLMGVVAVAWALYAALVRE